MQCGDCLDVYMATGGKGKRWGVLNSAWLSTLLGVFMRMVSFFTRAGACRVRRRPRDLRLPFRANTFIDHTNVDHQ